MSAGKVGPTRSIPLDSSFSNSAAITRQAKQPALCPTCIEHDGYRVDVTFVIAVSAVFNMRMRSIVSPSMPSSTIVTFPCCRCDSRIIGPRDEDDEYLIMYEDILKQWVPAEVGERLGLMDQLAHYPTNVAIVPWGLHSCHSCQHFYEIYMDIGGFRHC